MLSSGQCSFSWGDRGAEAPVPCGTSESADPEAELQASLRSADGLGVAEWGGSAAASVCNFPDAITHFSRVTVVSVCSKFLKPNPNTLLSYWIYYVSL